MDYNSITEQVARGNGVSTVMMGDLRDAHGAGKLGTTVVENIVAQLASTGLGHVPELTTSQWDEVRIYRKGTPVGRLIEAAKTVGQDNDETLRQSVGKDVRVQGLIEQIRELVCD